MKFSNYVLFTSIVDM